MIFLMIQLKISEHDKTIKEGEMRLLQGLKGKGVNDDDDVNGDDDDGSGDNGCSGGDDNGSGGDDNGGGGDVVVVER